MFRSEKFTIDKLKTFCRVAIQRMKIIQQKRIELSKRARKEISDLIADKKHDLAMIKTEQLIHEDYLVEARDILGSYCEQLLTRASLIAAKQNVDEGLAPIVITLIWVAPRMAHDVPELQKISQQFFLKYGKNFHDVASSDSMQLASPKIINCLSVHPPTHSLIERYMKAIADAYNVPFSPQHVEPQDQLNKLEFELVDSYNSSQNLTAPFTKLAPQPLTKQQCVSDSALAFSPEKATASRSFSSSDQDIGNLKPTKETNDRKSSDSFLDSLYSSNQASEVDLLSFGDEGDKDGIESSEAQHDELMDSPPLLHQNYNNPDTSTFAFDAVEKCDWETWELDTGPDHSSKSEEPAETPEDLLGRLNQLKYS